MQTFLQSYHLPWLLRASWQAAVLILLVLAAQWALGRRLGPRWRYGLWLLVVLRLALPWTLPSATSLFNLLNFPRMPALRMETGDSASEVEAREGGVARFDEGATTGASLKAAAAPQFGSTASLLLAVWSAGALALALGLGGMHLRLSRKVVGCRPLIDADVLNLLEDCKQLMGVRVPVTLIETAAVGSPALFGFVRPRLLLPLGLARQFTADELRYVLLHELSHVKRRDILLCWLMSGLQILHWFNPLVWLAFYRMRVERELACDALALSYANAGEHRPYGRTIIKLLENFGGSDWAPSLAGTVETKNQLTERITMIATFKKTKPASALAITLFAGLALLALTDAQPGQTARGAEENGGPAAERNGPPKIVATHPEVGAVDVDPSLSELTVTFDRDMGAGYSWTGSGPEYPPSPEGKKVQWRTRRTCVLPVTLSAGRYYRVGINSTSFQNFRSADGVPAQPSAIYFSTQGASDAIKRKAALPRIVGLSPLNGAKDVDPALTELRITFNVPMGPGFSWTGAGPQFPTIPAGKKPFWTEDHKTCVLPVELKPGSEYHLGLNSPSYKNFQSAGGVPLEPVAYSFKTK